MLKKICIEKEVVSIDSYVDGEEFLCTIPTGLIDLNLKKKHNYNELPWNPWPEEAGVVRRMGRWLLKYNSKIFSTFYKNKPLIKMIRFADDENGEWMLYDSVVHWRCNAAKKLPDLAGRRIHEAVLDTLLANVDFTREITEELKAQNARDAAALNLRKQTDTNKPRVVDDRQLNHALVSSKRGKQLSEQLKVDDVARLRVTDKQAKKVLGRNGYITSFGWEEFYSREKLFQLDLEWYRKHLMKLQRKHRAVEKKKLAEEKGVSVEELAEQKKAREVLEKRIERTQLWVGMSPDFHQTLDFLNEFARRMNKGEPISQEWYNKGRRAMRKLPETMKPLRWHFVK